MPNEREIWLIIRAKNTAAQAINAVRKGFTRLGTVGKKVAKVLNAGFRALRKTIRAIANVAKAALKAMLLPLAALGAGFVLAVRQAGSFQQSMANVGSVLGANIKTIDRLSRAAREMGKVSVFTAQEAAKAMYDLASAGFSADQVIASLKGTMLLAAATASDLTFTTETVTSTIKQFALQASAADRVANAFAATISFSKMNMDRLSTAMSFAGPVAAAFGHSLEGTLSVLAQFANLGLRASMIGTTFRMGLLQLQKAMPVEEIERGADVLKRLGITFSDIDPAMRSVADIVGALHGKVTQMSEAVALFGVRAGGPFLTLIKAGAGPLREFEKRITGTRKAFEMSAIQIATFYGSLKLFRSAIQEAQISLGTAFLPSLTKAVDQFTKWVSIINKVDWSDFWQRFSSGADTGIKQIETVLQVFGAGGQFRTMVMEWGSFFKSYISNLAKFVWIPIETELMIVASRMITNLKGKLGGALIDIGKALPMGLGSGMMGLGGGLIDQAVSAMRGAPEAEERLRATQRAKQVAALEALMRTRPTEAVEATTGFVTALTSALVGPTERVAQVTEEEKATQKIYMETVVDSLGKTHTIMTNSIERLNRQIQLVRSTVAQLDGKVKAALTSGQPEIGAMQ